MLQRFLDSDLLIPSIACFFAGSFGYIIIKLWLIPIISYWRTKRKVVSDLFDFHNADENDDFESLKTRLRQHAASLTRIFNSTLPYWYRLYLGNRGEMPTDAAKIIMRLVNTKNKDHRRNQMNDILVALKKEGMP